MKCHDRLQQTLYSCTNVVQDIQYTEKCEAISRTPRQAHHLCCWHSRLLLPEPGGHCHLRAAELAATVFELASAGSHTSPVTRPELLKELLLTLHLQMVGVWVMAACQAERHVCRTVSIEGGGRLKRLHAAITGDTASFSPAVAIAMQRKEPLTARSLLLASLTFAALNWAVVLE